MSCAEHYFENLLFNNRDIKDDINKKELSKDETKAIEMCATYILYTLFCGKEDFNNFIKERNLV